MILNLFLAILMGNFEEQSNPIKEAEKEWKKALQDQIKAEGQERT